jgi:hypothetical protein
LYWHVAWRQAIPGQQKAFFVTGARYDLEAFDFILVGCSVSGLNIGNAAFGLERACGICLPVSGLPPQKIRTSDAGRA